MGNQQERKKFLVFSIEECTACSQKTKRAFQAGDFVTKDGTKCSKCGNASRITMIYAEPPPKV